MHGPGTVEKKAAPADPAALVCPGCRQPTDPNINQCEHCGYLHLGWLASPSAESDGEQGNVDEGAARVGFIRLLGKDPDGPAGAIVFAIVGVAVLGGGLLLHNHFEPHKKLCESGVGAFAQEVSSSALKHCSLDSFLAEAGVIVAILGGLMLVGLVIGVLSLFVASQQQRG